MSEAWKRQQAIRELCEIVRRCMRDSERLAAGGGDIPGLIADFQRDIQRLRDELSSGDIAKIIDEELQKISSEPLTDFQRLSKQELRDLIAAEFRTCGLYSLDKFVSVKSIIRALAHARDSKAAAKPIQSSRDLVEIVGKNAHEYQAKLVQVRSETLPAKAKPDSSRRIEKKKAKRNVFSGIYRTLAGVAFIACNTATFQMKSSAKFADEHFKAAARDFAR